MNELLVDETMRRKLARIGIDELVRAMYAHAADRFVELARSWTVWTFIADDELDAIDDDAVAQRRVEQLLAHEGALGVELARVVDQFAAAAASAPHHAAAFVVATRRYLQACVWEAANRRTRTTPSAADYRRMRPHSGAMFPFLRIALVASDFTVEQEEQAQVASLLDAAAWLPCMANDLVSAEKELHAGDRHNVVLIMMHEHALDLATARARAGERYRSELAAYDHGLAQLDGILSPPQIGALRDLVHGAHTWLVKSVRYRATAAPGAA